MLGFSLFVGPKLKSPKSRAALDQTYRAESIGQISLQNIAGFVGRLFLSCKSRLDGAAMMTDIFGVAHFAGGG